MPSETAKTKADAATDSAATVVPAASSRAQGNDPALSLRGVRKAFADVQAVDGIDLEVRRASALACWGRMGRGRRRRLRFARG